MTGWLTAQRDASAPAATAPAPAAMAPEAAVAWTVPADAVTAGGPTVCRNGEQVAAVLRGIALRLLETGASLDEEGERSLTSMAATINGEALRYAAAGALAAKDPGQLDGFVSVATGLARHTVSLAVGRALDGLSLPEANPEAIQAALDDMTEQAHLAFVTGDEDALKQVASLLGKAKALPEKMKQYAERVKHVTDLLGKARAATRLGELAEKVGKIGGAIAEPIGKARDIVEVVRDIAVLDGIIGTPNGTAMMRGVNQFAAGMDLVDKTIGRFGSAVPLFGAVWSKIYKPMVDACVAGLRVLARVEERTGREFEILDMMISQGDGSLVRDANGAPVLSRAAITGGYFPGGQAVFSYVYAVRQGGSPTLTEVVRDFFLDRADLFNIPQGDETEQLSSGEWELFSPSTWFRSGRRDNVAAWVAANVGKVWGLLYGDLGREIP